MSSSNYSRINDSNQAGCSCCCMLTRAVLTPPGRVTTLAGYTCNHSKTIRNYGKWQSPQGYYVHGPVFYGCSVNFTMPLTAIDYDFLHGVCVGQASNPGPWSLRIQNIVSAQKHLDSLVFKDDCIVWTETSATRTTQERALRKCISTRYHAGFSHPASPKILEKTGRNEATGTMIFSKAPLQDMSGNMDAAIFILHVLRIASST